MALTKKEVEHVALLARLGLSEEEIKLFTTQLSGILDYADTINRLKTDGVPPTSHAIPMKNVMREDRVVPSALAGEILKNAPDEESGMFKVPKIME